MFKTLADLAAKAAVRGVIAHAPDRVIDAKIANYLDPKSKIEIVTNKIPSAFSPISGDVLEALDHSPVKTLAAADIEKEMPIIGTCANTDCGYVHRATPSLAVAVASEGNFHCVVCSEKVESSLKVDSDEFKAVSALIEKETAEVEEFKKAAEAETATAEDEDEVAEAAASDSDDDYLDDVMDGSSSDDDSADDEGDDDEGCEAAEAETDSDAEIERALAELEAELTEAEEETDSKPAKSTREDAPAKTEASVKDGVMPTVIVATASVDDWKVASLAMLSLKSEDPSWLILANNAPVGTLVKSKAHADLQSTFEDKQVFPVAFQQAITVAGMTEEVSARFGFSPLTLETTADSIIDRKVEERVAAEKTSLATAQEANRKVLDQSFTIAALQSIKGFMSENKLRDALTEILTKNRVTAADQLVDKAFELAAKPWLKSIVDKAMELAKESDDRRNATAEMVEKAGFQYKPMAAVASEQTQNYDVREIMAKGGSEVIELGAHNPETRSAPPSGSTLNDRIARAAQSLGRK